MPGPLRSLRRALNSRFRPPAVNFTCHVVEGAFWSFGDTLIGVGAVLPLLVVGRLGGSNMTLGLIQALLGVTFVAPLLAAPLLEAVRRKKRLVLMLGFPARLPSVCIIAALLLFGVKAPGLALLVLALSLLMKSASMALTIPPWYDVVAETIPENRVGRMFGFRQSLSAVMGAASGPACAAILAYFAFPGNYALLYGLSLVLLMVSWAIFAMVDEVPAHVGAPERQPYRPYFASLLAVLRDDAAFRYFLLYRAIGAAALAVFPFYAVAARRYHDMPEPLVAGSLILAQKVAAICGAFFGPLAAERAGRRRVIRIVALVGAAGTLVAAFAPAGHAALFIGAVFVLSLGLSAEGVCRVALAISLYPRGRRVGYSTLAMIAFGLAMTVMPPLAGWVMDHWGHAMLFYLTAAAVCASLIPLALCRPGDRGA
jgi:MFS family permease